MTRSLCRPRVPEAAARCLEALERGGDRACLVGGAVRDGLLGRPVGDLDLASSALPDQAEALLTALGVQVTGRDGTLLALHLRFGERDLQLTTFRREFGPYKNRRPARVEPLATFEEDAPRRDFTVNALALTCFGELLDPQNGMADLRQGLIRAIGVPALRFAEDPLRVLRALRFAAALGFELEPVTARGCREADLTGLKDSRALRAELAALLSLPDRGAVVRLCEDCAPSLLRRWPDAPWRRMGGGQSLVQEMALWQKEAGA